MGLCDYWIRWEQIQIQILLAFVWFLRAVDFHVVGQLYAL